MSGTLGEAGCAKMGLESNCAEMRMGMKMAVLQ